MPGQPPRVEGRIPRTVRWLQGLNAWQLIAVTTGAALAARLVGLPLVLLVQALLGEVSGGPDLKDASWIKVVALALVLAPLLETLIGQLAVLRLLAKVPALRARPAIP